MVLLNFVKSQAGGVGYPLLLMAVLALSAGGMLMGSEVAGKAGLSCRLTDNAQINRMLCSLSPDRLVAHLN